MEPDIGLTDRSEVSCQIRNLVLESGLFNRITSWKEQQQFKILESIEGFPYQGASDISAKMGGVTQTKSLISGRISSGFLVSLPFVRLSSLCALLIKLRS